MGLGGWQSKRVKPSSLAELQHLVVPTRFKSHIEQGEQSPMRDWSCEDDLSLAEEQSPPPHPQNDQTWKGWYYLRHVYKSSHAICAIWYPCYFSNNLNVWKLCSTIAEKCKEAEASNSWNFAWQNEQINGRIEDAHLCCRGEQKATWSNASCQVCLRGRCSSQTSNTNFDTLETLQETLRCRPL